jgi:carbon monoxide dehydrogenase subunit G
VINTDETVDVAVPPDDVFRVLTRPERYPAWIPGVVSCELLPGPPPGTAGSRFRIRVMGPIGHLDADAETVSAEPPRSLGIAAVASLFRLTAACDLEATSAGGTRLHVVAEIELSGMARFAEAMVRERIRNGLAAGRARLVAALEAEARSV